MCSSTALLRIEFTAPTCLHAAGELLPRLSTLTGQKSTGGISLLHLSEGHPWRALPVILALWSPDFPHAWPFGACPRSFGPLAKGILSRRAGIVKVIREKSGSGFTPLPLKNVSFTVKSLAEIPLQQALKRLAVTGLIARHLVDGVVDGVEVVALGAGGEVDLAGGGAELAVDAPCEVFLG